MYLRAAHADLHIPTLRQFIRANPLGILTTAIPSTLYPLLQCSHIPWILDLADENDDVELGTLRGHMAPANPHTKAMIESVSSPAIPPAGSSGAQLEQEVMVLFNGPVHHYVTPRFYTTTKPATGKVVPTWDYAAVQAYGRATIFFENNAETSQFLDRAVGDLTRQSENMMLAEQHPDKDTAERGEGWKVSDAPEAYLGIMKKNIIGIQIQVDRLEGKFKMSQELGKGDREGAIHGFKEIGTETGTIMAETIKTRGELSDSQKQAAKTTA